MASLSIQSWNIVKWTVSLSIILFVSIFLIFGFTEESNRINIRLSARISAVLFALAFMASSLQYFFKGQFTFWLLMNRKFIGISFAITHLIHLLLLGILHFNFHPIFQVAAKISLIGGGMAYFFLTAMLITSFDQFKSMLSTKSWKALHTIGGYWIWYIFIRSYWKRLTTEWEWLPLFLLFALVLILRLAKLWSTRKGQKVRNVIS